MNATALCSEPRRAPDAFLVGNSRRGKKSLDACMFQVEGHVRSERHWGWDGASLESVSAFCISAISQIKSKPNGKALIEKLEKSKLTHTIKPTTGGNSAAPLTGYKPGKGSGSKVNFDPTNQTGGRNDKGSTKRPPFVGLGHELGHAEAINDGTQTFDKGSGKKGTTPPSEVNSLKRENQIRKEHNETLRSNYY